MNALKTGSAKVPGKSLASKNVLVKIFLLMFVLAASYIAITFTYGIYFGKLVPQKIISVRDVLVSLFPEMTDYSGQDDIYIIKKSDKTIGYAFQAWGKGYGGPIQIIVGLEAANTVTGIVIISQTETNGLGSRVTLPRFTDQFKGKAIDNIKLTSDGGQIDGITGSTISSKAVIDAVRETALLKASQLPR